MAISALLESGIYQKIETEIKTVSPYGPNRNRRWYYFDVFWVPEKLKSTKPFTIDHSIPALIVLGSGLPFALMIFLLEVVGHFYQKKILSKGFGQNTKDKDRDHEITPKSRGSMSHQESVKDVESLHGTK